MKTLSTLCEFEEIFSIHKKITPMYLNFLELIKDYPNFPFKPLIKYTYITPQNCKWSNIPDGDIIPIGIKKYYAFADKMVRLLYLKRFFNTKTYTFDVGVFYICSDRTNFLNTCIFTEQNLANSSEIKLTNISKINMIDKLNCL